MADGRESTSVSVSGGAAKWLASRAAESEMDADDFLTRLVAAFRTIEDSGEVAFATETELESVADDVADVQSTVEAVESGAESDVEDLRERVVQVAEAADAKADADHDHPEVADRIEQTASAVKRLEGETRALSKQVEDLQDWADEGFENYEEVLEYLTEETEALDGKVGTVARVLVDVRRAVQQIAAAEEERAAAGALKHMANEQGVREAACEECGNSVDIALLTDATCPFCASTFSAVESSKRFGVFQSATLVTGERPALEAPEVEESVGEELAELVDDE